LSIGTLAIGFVLDTGTISKTAVDIPGGPGVGQTNVFCGFCRNGVTNQFARKCNGLPTGANCATDRECGAGNHCLPVQCNASNGNADCAAATGFQQCGQRTPGAFTASGSARTIFESGVPAGPITTGAAPVHQTLVSIFCIPPSFSAAV